VSCPICDGWGSYLLGGENVRCTCGAPDKSRHDRAIARAEKAVVRAAVAFNHVRFSHPPLGEFMGYLHRFEDAVDHLLAARAAAKKKGK